MRRLIVLAAVAVIAGCGGSKLSLEDHVRGEYVVYAKQQHFAPDTYRSFTLRCVPALRGTGYDHWCYIRPKGFRLTYDVPTRDGVPLWPKSGVGAGPPR